MKDVEERLTLIRHRTKPLQNMRPEDVVGIEYVVEIGAEIEELVEGLLTDYRTRVLHLM